MGKIESPLMYQKEVRIIKQAILASQGNALRMVSGVELSLYFGIGLYVSAHSREGVWGTGALKSICEQLHKELPGLRGFSEENVKKMRGFAEFWNQYLNRSALPTDLQLPEKEQGIEYDAFSLTKWSAMPTEINREEFLSISFSHHDEILHKTKNINEVLFYIHETVVHSWSTRTLRESLKHNLYREGESTLPNNFVSTMTTANQALKAIRMFKDEYLLDFINAENIDEDEECVNERVVEQQIVRNIRDFIMTFGRDFAFLGNQYHLEICGIEHFPDLLFFNRELNALVVIELKIGAFKSSYLGQLFTYLKILDEKVKKPHENNSVGIILCKEANKTYAEFAVRDYTKPMGVATYKTLTDMPANLRDALPDIEELKQLL